MVLELMIEKNKKPNIWQIIISILGAIIGVQHSRVRERDFVNGRPWWVYLIVGILFILILIILIILLAKYILIKAGVT